MTRPVGQVACFRVFPERKSRLFYRVRIFRTIKTLRAYIDKSHIVTPLGHGVAMVSSWSESYCWKAKGAVRPRRMRKRPLMGEILLTTRWLGMEVVAHECTHAALGWFRRLGVGVPNESEVHPRRGRVCAVEERFCYGLGQMARQIAIQLWARKLIH